MVILNKREEKLVHILEERVAILTARMKAANGQDLPWVRQERSGILWALQVVARARAMGGEEVFASTFTRGEDLKHRELFRQSVEGCIERTNERDAARAAAEAARKAEERRQKQAERQRASIAAEREREATLKWRAEAAAILDRASQARLRQTERPPNVRRMAA